MRDPCPAWIVACKTWSSNMHYQMSLRPKKPSFKSTWHYTITQWALCSSTLRTCTWRTPSACSVPTKVCCRHASSSIQLSWTSAMPSSYQRSICVWVVQPCAWQPMLGATSKAILLSTTWPSRLPTACSSSPCRLVNRGPGLKIVAKDTFSRLRQIKKWGFSSNDLTYNGFVKPYFERWI
jgi:hypothetical protein